MDRVDLFAVKNRLSAVLGESKQKQYWDLLRKYMLARYSKVELDIGARKLLGSTNISLHNLFIKSIIHNARHPRLPETPKSQQPASQFPTGHAVNSLEPKKKKQKTGLSPNSLLKVPYSPKRKEDERKDAHIKRGIKGVVPLPQPVPLAPNPPPMAVDTEWSNNTMLLPDSVSLKSRMKKIAKTYGVSDISEDCTALLLNAMDIHMKDIIAACISQARPMQRKREQRAAEAAAKAQQAKKEQTAVGTDIGISLGVSALPTEASRLTNHPSDFHSVTDLRRRVTVNDLMSAMDFNPNLLGEDRTLNQERINMMQFY
eukprot:GFYU01005306.1.p1 GENE.GFYU01005306.1~~GFYU01005306.1.p1  ORF type:complete len:315 (+),score=65.09 GFYU01005306.1:209-1153(+)